MHFLTDFSPLNPGLHNIPVVTGSLAFVFLIAWLRLKLLNRSRCSISKEEYTGLEKTAQEKINERMKKLAKKVLIGRSISCQFGGHEYVLQWDGNFLRLDKYIAGLINSHVNILWNREKANVSALGPILPKLERKMIRAAAKKSKQLQKTVKKLKGN